VRPVVDRPLEFAARPVHVAQAEVGPGEDASIGTEAPVLGQPAVERREGQRDRFRVVAERLLVEHPERGEQPHRLETVLVEGGDAGIAVPVGGVDALPGSEELPRLTSLGVAAEVVVERTGRGHGVEGGVDHAAEDPSADDLILAPVDVAPLDAPLAEGGVEVAGEGVERLVVVVVAVEGPVPEFRDHGLCVNAHWHLSLRNLTLR
jgi:hypothetical protein